MGFKARFRRALFKGSHGRLHWMEGKTNKINIFNKINEVTERNSESRKIRHDRPENCRHFTVVLKVLSSIGSAYCSSGKAFVDV